MTLLLQKPFNPTPTKSTRVGFGDALLALGKANAQVVGLCADLTGSLQMTAFQKQYPERFFQMGVAEANMIGVASGLSTAGFIPFACTFANFATGRVYDQIRQSVAYSKKNVKICASHAGLTLGEDGATHQILEDIGMMRNLPGMTVINTCDYAQTYEATLAIAAHEGPVYLRFGRPNIPCCTDGMPFVMGKALPLTKGKDVTIVATGHLVAPALVAYEIMKEKGIEVEVINIHTIKPLDVDSVRASVKKTGCLVSAEEHQKTGGLGSAVAEYLSANYPVPMEYIGVSDTFGESGKAHELMEKYGLTALHIVQQIEKVIQRKLNMV